jgi:hypothetical protein
MHANTTFIFLPADFEQITSQSFTTANFYKIIGNSI